MNAQTKVIQRTYLMLTFISTLSASLIWGINTLFLLDAGLNNFEAFTANAFFTLGQVLFEIPTGIVADSWGRRFSYLLGASTLTLSTLLYLFFWYVSAPLWMWGAASLFIGLGFTFFSGATEAWLIDALMYSKYKGNIDSIFAKSQVAAGIAMLLGSIGGGIIAEITNLGAPYILRIIFLSITFIIAFIFMRDLGFTPVHPKKYFEEIKKIFKQSIDSGLKNPPVRWLMLSMPFTTGISIYVFYALQPYLLQLYGDPTAYSIAGLAAAGIASAQIIGGLITPFILRLFHRRTTILLSSICLASLSLFFLGFFTKFSLALFFLGFWAMSSAISTPVYQSLINALIPSQQRATILSFNNLMGSSGGVITQPFLGRAADVYSYATSYMIASLISFIAFWFILFTRFENIKADSIMKGTKKI